MSGATPTPEEAAALVAALVAGRARADEPSVYERWRRNRVQALRRRS